MYVYVFVVLRTLEQISLKEQFTNFEDFKMKVVASLTQQGLNTYKKLVKITYFNARLAGENQFSKLIDN